MRERNTNRKTIAERIEKFKEDWKEDYSTRKFVGRALEGIGILEISEGVFSVYTTGNWKALIPAAAGFITYAVGQIVRDNGTRDETLYIIKAEEEAKKKEEEVRMKMVRGY